jgi:hypothetical protein
MDEHQAQQHPGDAVQQRGLVAELVHGGVVCWGHSETAAARKASRITIKS